MGLNLTVVEPSPEEVAKSTETKLPLPVPTMTAELVEVNGIEGLSITSFFPLQIDGSSEKFEAAVESNKTVRMGKTTYQKDEKGQFILDASGQKIVKEDNSKKIHSILTLLGQCDDMPIKIGTAFLKDEDSGTVFYNRQSVQGRVENKDVPGDDE